jgi:hypothetical protein
MIWTPDRITTLTNGYAAGKPVQKIADELGTTRRGVIGKAWRLGLKHPEWKHERKAKIKPPKPTGKMMIALMEMEPIGDCLFIEIAGDFSRCHAPVGRRDGVDYWCGRPVEDDSSYCSNCSPRLYAVSQPKTKFGDYA